MSSNKAFEWHVAKGQKDSVDARPRGTVVGADLKPKLLQ